MKVSDAKNYRTSSDARRTDRGTIPLPIRKKMAATANRVRRKLGLPPMSWRELFGRVRRG